MADYTVGDTVYKRFTTRSFTTGAPTQLAGTPVVSAYEDDSATQITAGITLGVDHDSVTGLNLLTIVATGANGFESGKSYDIVITTGTVGGVSVVGEVVWHFTLEAEAAATSLAAGVTLADGAHGGTSAVLTLDHVIIASSTDHGIDIQIDTAANKHGVNINASTATAVGVKVHGDLSGAVYSNTAGSAGFGMSIISNGSGGGLDISSNTGIAIDTQFTGAASLGTALLAEINAQADLALSDAALPSAASILTAIMEDDNSLRTTPASFGKVVGDTGSTVNDLPADVTDAVLTTAMTESYAANGAAPTLAQAQFAIHQMLMQFGIAETSLTVRRLNNTTTAFVVTLDDATNPTDAARV